MIFPSTETIRAAIESDYLGDTTEAVSALLDEALEQEPEDAHALCVTAQQYEDVRRELVEAQRTREGLAMELHEVEQVIAAAFPDEFPTGPDSSDRCIGEHTAATLAAYVVRQLADAQDQEDRLTDDVIRLLSERNEVARVAASYFRPGPDGQDELDREELIREWMDLGRDEADDYRKRWHKAVDDLLAARRELAEAGATPGGAS